jgi:hypothetical protein
MLAREFVRAGHEVTLVTKTLEEKKRTTSRSLSFGSLLSVPYGGL